MSEWYGGNRYLKVSEMTANAKYITSWLLGRGWSINAICGMLGNMQSESGINPSIWESLKEDTSRGYGLVQWTPATKYLNWCAERGLEPSDMDSNLERIEYEVENGLQWISTSSYPMSFAEFKCSENSVEELAKAFLFNYERPLAPKPELRAKNAVYWYKVVMGTEPVEPDKHIKEKKMSLIMLLSTMKRKG